MFCRESAPLKLLSVFYHLLRCLAKPSLGIMETQNPVPLCLFFLLVMFLGNVHSLAAVAKQDAQPQKNEAIVEMEKLEIFAAKYKWHYAKTERFEILSDLETPKLAVGIIRQFEQLIDLFEKNCRLFRPNLELPVKIIFVRNKGIERFLVSTNKVSIEFNWQDDADRPLPMSSAQRITGEQMVLVQLITDNYLNAKLGYTTMVKENAFELLVAYLRGCLRSHKIVFGDHLTHAYTERGFLGIDSRSRLHVRLFDRDSSNRGKISTRWLTINADDISLRRYDHQGDLISFHVNARDYPAMKPEFEKQRDKIDDRFMKSGPNIDFGQVVEKKKTYAEVYRRPQYATMQAWERWLTMRRMLCDFEYYCVFGPNPATREPYARLVEHSNKAPFTESVFKEYFGMGYDQFYKEMYDYYRKLGKDRQWGPPEIVVSRFRERDLPKPVSFVPARRTISARVIGEWFSLFLDTKQLAVESLRKAYKEDPETHYDPEFLARLGLSEAQAGDKAMAITLLERATMLKVARPQAYISLAKLRLETIRETKGKGHKLTAGEIAPIMAPLLAVLPQPQATPYACIQIANLWRRTDLEPPVEVFETLIAECGKFPDDFNLLNTTVPLLAQHGRNDDATRILKATAKCVLNSVERKKLAQLEKDMASKTVTPPDEAAPERDTDGVSNEDPSEIQE